ncbi:hypothetical protein QYF36_025304 [Acer negundo]|nr:hypothetical protein QYF36_025304 [Acer negundo]
MDFSFHQHAMGPATIRNQSDWSIYMHAGVGETGSALDEDGDTTLLETTWHAMEDLVSMGLVRIFGIRYVC